MKCFEKLVRDFITSSLPASMDPLQFAYRHNHSTDDAIAHLLHTTLTHLDKGRGNYVKMLYVDYSSAFNTLIPSRLTTKLEDPGLHPYDKRAYLEEIKHLESWCQENNLLLNISKTKELIVDCNKKQEQHYQPLRINGTTVERVDSFRYLGIHISQDLSWSRHTNCLAKKARQRLYHLRCLRDFRLPSKPIEEDIKSLKVALEMKNQEIRDQHDHLSKLYKMYSLWDTGSPGKDVGTIAYRGVSVCIVVYVSVYPSTGMYC
ncbi:hypothetical protein P4O66_004460 [Electrophorus voltai]|uniref:Alkylated DNA repair protein AlkB homologue 8 N-terminal domain-containing protein n=1 Tax=Electrophorus voltai TaxID=2609070 RepID=A0AAD9E2N7_9TELE|nr:hypothetical protein P4O66_004460 [Electrophorus voltai]